MSDVVFSILRLPLSLAMLFYQSVVLAIAQIWANKTRGILTTLGILIGVAAISAVIALITGMRDKVLAEFEQFGANKLSIQPDSNLGEKSWAARWKVVFKPTDFDELLEKCPSLASVTRDCGMGETGVAANGTQMVEADTHMRGIDADWHMIERRGVTAGRPITAMDNLQVRRVILIDETLRDLLHLGHDPTGKIIETQYWGRFLVVGLLESSAVMMSRDSQTGQAIMRAGFASLTGCRRKARTGRRARTRASSARPRAAGSARSTRTYSR